MCPSTKPIKSTSRRDMLCGSISYMIYMSNNAMGKLYNQQIFAHPISCIHSVIFRTAGTWFITQAKGCGGASRRIGTGAPGTYIEMPQHDKIPIYTAVHMQHLANENEPRSPQKAGFAGESSQHVLEFDFGFKLTRRINITYWDTFMHSVCRAYMNTFPYLSWLALKFWIHIDMRALAQEVSCFSCFVSLGHK